MSFTRTVTGILLLGSLLGAAEPMKLSTPTPKSMASDLRGPGPFDEKYPIPQDAAKSKKLREASKAWYRAQIVEPFLTGPNAKAPWANTAKAMLEASADYLDACFSFDRHMTSFTAVRAPWPRHFVPGAMPIRL